MLARNMLNAETNTKLKCRIETEVMASLDSMAQSHCVLQVRDGRRSRSSWISGLPNPLYSTKPHGWQV